MKSKSIILKTAIFNISLIVIILLMNSCKKEQLKIDQEKKFSQVDFKFDPTFPYDGGWGLTLKPNGVADIIPGGDIYYRGNYKISGKNLTVTTDHTTFKFDILSETEIKEKQYGTILRLNP
ncbi:hypothetical protein QWY86_18535 [Pedobacter aquatilis]|uniref:hypothetical protein n=1 Tax=Pedobacter aquatilis TaxID=351343 RepID=UPI0025B4AB5F|nr:hypothetical protein [Pedobacter aquatilis]MDN3588686.1 hypothetical protein [Pedobacter aquatilis]